MIETLDDIIEEMANTIGIYRGHDNRCNEKTLCRICWTTEIKDRIVQATSTVVLNLTPEQVTKLKELLK